MPTFSIITATYNRPQLLERMIDSVLRQTFTDWELIIIDDSTNDEVQRAMAEYMDNPKIIYLKNGDNMGLPHSRNRGLDTAQGKWITLLDDDDYYATDETLSEIVRTLTSTTLPWVAFNKISPDGVKITKILKKKDKYNWTKDFLFGKSLRGDIIPVFRKDFLSNTRYWGAKRSEWQFWFDLAKKSDFEYYPIDAVVAEYLPDGMTNVGYKQKERTYLQQQFFHMLKSVYTIKYLPIIVARYILSFSLVEKTYKKIKP